MDLAAAARRLPGSKYLEWLSDTVRPDLGSRISLEIPAYDEPELQKTIRSALAMAAAPDRVHFAVCLQGGTDEDEAFLKSLDHCRYVTYAAGDAPGSCAARADCQDLLDGEDYVLRLDGHMRFAWGWDVALIRQWQECNDPKAVLTEHPMDYTKLFDEENPLFQYIIESTFFPLVESTFLQYNNCSVLCLYIVLASGFFLRVIQENDKITQSIAKRVSQLLNKITIKEGDRCGS